MRHLPTFLTLCLPALAVAAVVEDFTAKPGLVLVGASERGTSAAVESVAGTGNAALVVRIAEQHGKLHEVYFGKGVAQQAPATVTVRVKRSGAFEYWGLSLRVKDAKGECFQFPTAIIPGDDWTTLRYAVGEGLHKGHWGNPSTGVMEGAWVVCGFAVSCSEKAGAGEVWLDDVSCEAAAAP